MSPHDPFGLVGQVLDGQYRIERYIGEGGFSVVYRGVHIGLSEPIAVKCLKVPPALGSALVESVLKRFRDESRIHYKLSQGNLHIVRSIASGTTTSPATGALVPYTVLEWLEGHSLADDLTNRRDRRLKGRPLAEVIKLLDSAVDALAYAHAQGVVHRDLNPGNLFLAKTASGPRLKVLDFGVAKILADSALDMTGARTFGNVQMFAPAYGAPEQFDSRLGAVGAWTDVYALALLVVELLTDTPAINGEHLGEYAQAALDAARRPTPRAFGANVGDAVERVLSRAVALSPSERPRDAGELWGMLKNAMQVDQKNAAPVASAPPPGGATLAGPGVVQESRPPPPTLRLDSAASLQEASKLYAASRVARSVPRSGSEALASTPFPSKVAPPPSVAVPTPSPPPVDAPAPIARPSWAPPPPPSMGTPLSTSVPALPRPRTSALIVIVAGAVLVGSLVAGAWILFARTHQAWKTPVTGSSGEGH